MYKNLTINEGVQLFPRSLFVALFNKADYFFDIINPIFNTKQVRYRCLFKNGLHCLTVYLYLTEEEINVVKWSISLPCEIYLFGQYDQVDIFLIRVWGKISEINGDDKIKKIDEMAKRFNGEKIDFDHFPMKIDKVDKDRGLASLLSLGKLFLFEPISYACEEIKKEECD